MGSLNATITLHEQVTQLCLLCCMLWFNFILQFLFYFVLYKQQQQQQQQQKKRNKETKEIKIEPRIN